MEHFAAKWDIHINLGPKQNKKHLYKADMLRWIRSPSQMKCLHSSKPIHFLKKASVYIIEV